MTPRSACGNTATVNLPSPGDGLARPAEPAASLGLPGGGLL